MTLDLDAIKARCEAATPGPWEADGTELYGSWEEGRPWLAESCRLDDPKAEPDATFIAAARTDVPALVVEVERLTKALRVANAAIAGLRRVGNAPHRTVGSGW